jgi:hypothetical protein
MLGDNSVRSKDSRLWTNPVDPARPPYAVHQDELIGKVLLIYFGRVGYVH